MPASSWIIGSDPACDLPVDRPSVSWRHCCLTRLEDGTYRLEDLGSTNGTFVNGCRINGSAKVGRADQVTLGLSVAMPWPSEQPIDPGSAPAATTPSARVLTVGRDAENDLVIDDPEVSGFHARVVIAAGGREAVVEDLGSTNGTSVNDRSKRLARATFTADDVLFFGPIPVPARRFFPYDSGERRESVGAVVIATQAIVLGRGPECDHVVDFPAVSSRHARIYRVGTLLEVEDLGSSNGTSVNGVRIARPTPIRAGDILGLGSYQLRVVDANAAAAPSEISPIGLRTVTESIVRPVSQDRPVRDNPLPPKEAAIGKGAVIAAGIALGAQAGVIAEGILIAAGRSPSAALFGMAVSTVWFGMTATLFEKFLLSSQSPGQRRSDFDWTILARSLGKAAIYDLAFAAVLTGVAAAKLSFGDASLWAFAVLWLGSLVGSAVGMVLASASPRLSMALAGAVALILVMSVIGGPGRPLPSYSQGVAALASALPSRWVHEALLSTWIGAAGGETAGGAIESYFPSTTLRSGPRACVAALLAMLLGAVYSAMLIAIARQEGPATSPAEEPSPPG